MLYVALKFLQLLQLIKQKLNKCRKNVYDNNFRNKVSKSDWFYSVTIISRHLELKVFDTLLTNWDERARWIIQN